MSGAHRLAMLRNMATSLLEHEKIITTHARAKEARKFTERLITIARRSGRVKEVAGEGAQAREARVRAHGVASRRRVAALIRSKVVLAKLFEDIAPRYADRNGGYLRIIKYNRRGGDNAPMSVLELIPGEAPPAQATDAGGAGDESP
jgi:large subunit ribosomal protein L17